VYVLIALSRRLLPPVVALLILLTAAVLTGCAAAEQPGGASGTTAPTPTTESTTGGPTTTSEQAVLADGRHPVFLQVVDAGQRTITFDLIQYLTGDAATRAAAEDGEESPPPNDYYIRNVNPRLRTLSVRADASITVNQLALESNGGVIKDTTVTLAKLATWFPNTARPMFWITVEQGQVTKLTENYLP
jgi:hypothetical protein